ncbi:MAG: winged helix-turn-helix transcriptional regulator, partial [Bacilli bacterium]|nr:winged helix-turn-helix transcriptional regulator [Bacilli bacterium]
LLLDNNGLTITREKMIESVWGYDFLGESRTIDVHIKELRRKLREIGLPDDVIQTQRGIGYKMVL